MSQIVNILNLYACLGGNRYKWDEVANQGGFKIKVTAVELDADLATMYQERFPNDIVIVADAHKYLLDHYKEFDFIWSSPPCPSHSRARYWSSSNYETKTKPVYPDLKLYEEILFLQHYYKNGNFCVENVIPYYSPLILPQKRGRHLYWTNFNLPDNLNERNFKMGGLEEVKRLCEFHAFDFYKYKGKQRIDKIARNLVDYESGKTIFATAMNVKLKENTKQQTLF